MARGDNQNQWVGARYGAGPFYRWRVRKKLGSKKLANLFGMNTATVYMWSENGIPEKHLREMSEKCGENFQPKQDRWLYGKSGPSCGLTRIVWLARQGHKPSLWTLARIAGSIIPKQSRTRESISNGIRRGVIEMHERNGTRRTPEQRQLAQAKQVYRELKKLLRTNRRKHNANHAVVEGE